MNGKKPRLYAAGVIVMVSACLVTDVSGVVIFPLHFKAAGALRVGTCVEVWARHRSDYNMPPARMALTLQAGGERGRPQFKFVQR